MCVSFALCVHFPLSVRPLTLFQIARLFFPFLSQRQASASFFSQGGHWWIAARRAGEAQLRFHQDKGKGKLFTLTSRLRSPHIPPQMDKKSPCIWKHGLFKLFVQLINEPSKCLCVWWGQWDCAVGVLKWDQRTEEVRRNDMVGGRGRDLSIKMASEAQPFVLFDFTLRLKWCSLRTLGYLLSSEDADIKFSLSLYFQSNWKYKPCKVRYKYF